MVIGIYLYYGPGEIVREPCVLCLNANEIGVAVSYSFPDSFSGVIAPAGGDYVVGSVSAKAKLCKWSGEIGSLSSSAGAFASFSFAIGVSFCKILCNDCWCFPYPINSEKFVNIGCPGNASRSSR